MKKINYCLLIFLIFLSSCVSYTVKDSESIQKVDGKILDEFNEYADKGDFYEASRSYIEFINCCDDERKDELVEELTRLYKEKISEFQREGKKLQPIEYTYSFINLMKGSIPDSDLLLYERNLEEYVQLYIDSDLRSMGGLEQASWLVYLLRISHGEAVKRSLVELFNERKNPILAQKYLDHLLSVEGEATDRDDIGGDYPGLEDRITALKEEEKKGFGAPENAIEKTVKSSVKIVVDKGIKTEGGVGHPDQAIGTGIVIDEDGYILTNYHIIESSVDPTYEGYSRIYVIPGKDENVRFVAKVAGFDSVYDIALLKIEKQMESHIRIGDSDSLHQGESVIAIGNPAGLTNTVTSGVISSTDRPFLQIGDIIQIDAALNPGNSGGALINDEGYLVGVAFAGLENFENLNFAIPSNLVLSILNRLYGGGEVQRSWIGCAIGEEGEDLIVEYVVPDSPASVCGIEKGDIIREVNDKPVSTLFDLQSSFSYLSRQMIGTLTLERNDKTLRKKIYVDERPVYPSLYIYNRDAYENIITPLFGIVVSKVEPSRKKSYVIVRTLYGSIASSAGISEGDVIKLKDIKYDEENKLFYLVIDLKSRRFGYLNKSMVLYRYVEVNSFI